MMTGRTRPVSIEVPPDVLAAPVRTPAEITAARIDAAPLPDEQVRHAASLLTSARRPLIVAGGGANRPTASAAVTALAERLGAPAVMTTNGKGTVSARSDLAFHAPAIWRLLPRADVVLAVGTRFAKRDGTRWKVRDDQRLIKVDIDEGELCRGITPDLPIHGDAAEITSAILALVDSPDDRSGWGDLGRVRAELDAEVQAFQPQAAFGDAIRSALPDDAIVIDGMNQVGYWSRIGFPVYQPRTFISPGYQGTLGFELPTGLGAKVGAPTRPVVVICGDGGLMFNVGELATAVQHQINVVTILFNDNAFGNVLRTQQEMYEGRVIASELHNPDFVRLAESFGVSARRATDPAELGQVLKAALADDRPTVIEVPVGRMPDPWPLIQSH